MTSELQAAQGAITQLAGGSGELNLEAIKASLPGNLMSSVQINLNIGQGLPEITLAPEAPPELVPWVDAIRQLATSAAQIAIDAPGLVKDVMALVDAAKAFPGEAPASIQAAVTSGAIKPLEAAKLPKKIVGNVEAMAQIPTDLANLGKEAVATMELVQALVQ